MMRFEPRLEGDKRISYMVCEKKKPLQRFNSRSICSRNRKVVSGSRENKGTRSRI